VNTFKVTDLIVVLFLSLVAGYFIVSFLVPERVWKDLCRRSRFSRFTRRRSNPAEDTQSFRRPPEQDARNRRNPKGIKGAKSEEPMTEQECAKTLGLSGRVTLVEIKTAYRSEIAKYHPDKVTHLAPEFREMARIRTRRIRAAYEFLRGKYGMR
jgi:DnaJ-domain-containing protein 1